MQKINKHSTSVSCVAVKSDGYNGNEKNRARGLRPSQQQGLLCDEAVRVASWGRGVWRIIKM